MAHRADTHTQERTLQSTGKETLQGHEVARRAVGYIRVSTDMQATEGLSLEAQQAAIERFCAAQGFKLVRLCQDVISGAKSERPGLSEALGCLQRGVEVLVVLKFDRLSRSIRHFCELYDRYFRSGEKELVAIRESIRLDSSLGRALVNILLVFAQMEREATAERTREAMRHIKHRGYHYGKVPYGFQSVPASDQPRFKVLVENPAQPGEACKIEDGVASGIDNCDKGSFCGSDCACHKITDPLPDLVLNPQRLKDEVLFDYVTVDQNSCSVVEQCVGGLGKRRVLRFSVEAINQGQATLTVPPPDEHPEQFHQSTCHGHYHFDGFASYGLLDGSGKEIVAGRKQPGMHTLHEVAAQHCL